MRGLVGVMVCVLLALSMTAPPSALAATNDAFGSATVVTTFPYAETVDLASASVEPGEPSACGGQRTRSVWYTLTAPETGVIVTGATGYSFTDLRLTTYSAAGDGFAGLTQVGCRFGTGAPITSTVRVTAGVRYYVQVSDGGSGGGSIGITISFYLPPANDSFENATTVTGSAFTDTVEQWAATTEPGEPNVCAIPSFLSRRSVWYRFVAPADGDLVVDVVGTPFPGTNLAGHVQLGSGLAGLSTGGCGSDGTLFIGARAGRTYYVQATDSASGWGTLTVNFAFIPGIPPANDALANAHAVTTLPFEDVVNLRFASVESGEPNPCAFARTRTAWYALTPAAYGVATVTVTGFPGAAIAAYASTGPGFGGLTSATCGAPGSVSFTAQAGQTFYLQVSDSGSGWGWADVQVSYVNLPPPPPPAANDDFADATVVGALPFSDLVDISATTSEPGEPAPCGGTSRTAWYAYTAPADGYVAASPQTSRYWDPVLTAYRADGPGFGGLTRIGCSVIWSMVTFPVEAGVTYYVQASDTGSGAGALGITFTETVAPPANDRFADATAVTAFPFSDTVQIDGAYRESGEPSPCSATPQHTVWYALTTPYGGTVTVDGTGSTFWDVNLQVYRAAGSGFSGLSFMTCQFVQPVTFTTEPGATYYVQASEAVTPSGSLHLTFTYTPPPDTTPPAIAFQGNASPYALDEPLAIAVAAVDDRDGAVTPSCALTRDADAMTVSTSCALGGYAWELGLGGFTYAASAADAAGNTGQASTHVEVIATYPSLRNLVLAWAKPSVANGLVALLDSAWAGEQRGQEAVEANVLTAFRALVRAQSGKAIPADRAEMLTTFSYGL